MGIAAHPESKDKEPGHRDGEDCQRPCGEHALVGGAYPYEFCFSCRWCGDDDNGQCRFCYYSANPEPARSCVYCGHCDCSDGHHGEALLCQTVGECSGMWYDVVFDAVRGEVMCLNCFETRNWF